MPLPPVSPPFKPLIRNAHLQSVLAHYWPRRTDTRLYAVETWLFRPEPDVQVRIETQRPNGTPAGHLVMLHGLEGSSRSGYLLSLAKSALDAGYVAHRFNTRTCGGTEHLCRTLYHAGLTSDLLAFAPAPAGQGNAPVWLCGFSLGGNMALKLAGELGETARGLIAGVCAVSTPIDLAACARRIGRSGQLDLPAPFPAAHEGSIARHRPVRREPVLGAQQPLRSGRPHHCAFFRLQRRGRILPDAVGSRFSRPDTRSHPAHSGARRFVHPVRDLFASGDPNAIRACGSSSRIMAGMSDSWRARARASGPTG